ncbi:MAG: NADP-dependent oxidoreductase [Acidobacteria bacterium]|nr:NADP-dependent oxidoreductase [Acidobacteriota bacterium]MXZ70098.1 NADP-dependent oxidoreductase [Acidobacteriota bacterium]MYJ03131.1 NADP-dependent oxidoreductase [Acidobacteriota bacterium]
MTSIVNRQVCLAAHPSGFPRESDFRVADGPVPEPGAGQMLCRTIYLSLDPYMRGRMNPGPSYAPGVGLGEVMVGGTVSQVVHSNLDGYVPGDIVLNGNGWQQFGLSDGTGVRKLDPAAAPTSTALGVLGMPGMTAYVGLLDHGRPRPGETVVVSAASGAVGAVVGQIARIRGCRVVGIAGAQEKCEYVVNELGFDACVSHRGDDLSGALRAACPDGIDVYFENVGGKVFEAVLPLLNTFARVPVCGRIANYNLSAPPPGPDGVPKLMGLTLVRRITFRGFIVFDHRDREPDFLRDVSGWLREGRIRYREDIVDGIDHAINAFLGLLEGKNFGKLLVRVAEDPTR